MTLRVFDVQRFSVHDGPGIRTVVFLKGCTLRCVWCQNPESIRANPELMFFRDKCDSCGDCTAKCPRSALQIINGSLNIDRSKCDAFGRCVSACPRTALQTTGRDMEEDEVLKMLLKDREYYEESGGGVTFSGGEPLMQYSQLISLTKSLRSNNVNAAVETSAHISSDIFKLAITHFDFAFLDIKHVNEDSHYRATGGSLKLILSNIRYMDDTKRNYAIRIPLVPVYGIYDVNQIGALKNVLGSLKNLKYVEFLRYHRLGDGKYTALDREPIGRLEELDPSFFNRLKEEIGDLGFEVRIT